MATIRIEPTTLAGAAIVIQVCLLFISFVTLLLLANSSKRGAAALHSQKTLVLWLLCTLVVILMGEDLYATWGPMLGSLTLPSVRRDLAFLAVFVLDILFVTFLILNTGGSKRSPFTSVLLLLPTLAIFLREPVGRFLVYSAAVGLLYVLLLKKSFRLQPKDIDSSEFYEPAMSDELTDDRATIWANISCLVLATLIGAIAQP